MVIAVSSYVPGNICFNQVNKMTDMETMDLERRVCYLQCPKGRGIQLSMRGNEGKHHVSQEAEGVARKVWPRDSIVVPVGRTGEAG